MKGFYEQLTLVVAVLLLSQLTINAQLSESEIRWQQLVDQKQQSDDFEGFQCSHDVDFSPELEKNGAACEAANAGYGTPGWNPSSSPETNNFDPACTVPAALSDCNGGKYRIALRNIIFECPDWTGDNYLETGGGFQAMSDEDLTKKLAQVNEYFANANLEIVEVDRVRIESCDMYDFYWKKWGKDPLNTFSDGESDDRQLPSYDEPNVINLYWVGGFNGNHGCCGILGYVDKPPSERDFGVMRYGVSTNPSYLHHELSHYFGVYHTHWDLDEYSNVKGMPDGALDNSDCLTTGDGVCDTWPDPNFEAKCVNCRNNNEQHCYKDDSCGFNMEAFECEKGVALAIDPNNGVNIDEYTSTILRQNFTTYNNHECRSTFTPCQYYKMNTVALSCRSHLSISNPDFYFENTNDYEKEVALGDLIPVFEAGKTYVGMDGNAYDLTCFDWFLNEDDLMEEAVLSGSSNFDPSPYVNGIGTYTFYFSEVNALNNPPAKIAVHLVITAPDYSDDDSDDNSSDDDNTDDDSSDTDDNSDDDNNDTDDDNSNNDDTNDDDDCDHPRPGYAAGLTHYTLSEAQNILLETVEAFLGEGESLSWWISKKTPISSSIKSQAALNEALENVAFNPENNGDHIGEDAIFEASRIDDLLMVDCGNLEADITYYATPLILKSNVSTTDVPENCEGQFVQSQQKLGSGESVAVATLNKGSIPCLAKNDPYKIVVTVEGYTGSEEDFSLFIVAQDNAKEKASVVSGGNGIYLFDHNDLDDYHPDRGLRVAVFESNGEGGATVELSVSLIEMGEISSYNLEATYSNCLFGTPVSFECETSEEQSIDGRNEFVKESLRLYPSPTYNDFINLNYQSVTAGVSELVVYDMNGRLVKREKWAIKAGENRLLLQLDGFTNGVYLLKLIQEHQIQNAKFTVIRE